MQPLAHELSGNGPPVLLIHGFPLCRCIWQEQHDPLNRAGYRVLTPDLPGFGDSPETGERATMDDYADALIDLLNERDIDKVVAGGMSMGGYILFNLIERYPERLAGAVFAVTRAGADTIDGRVKREEMAISALRHGATPVAHSFAEILFAAPTMTEYPQLVADVTAWMEQSHPRGMAAALRAMAARKDYTETLGSISLPTLVIGAAEDRTIPVELSRAIASGIPDARYVEIPAAGHMVMLEQPAIFNAAVLGFLDSLPRW